jgi:hypothetical protein
VPRATPLPRRRIRAPEFRREEQASAKTFARPPAAQIIGETRLWLDENSGPAALLQIECL